MLETAQTEWKSLGTVSNVLNISVDTIMNLKILRTRFLPGWTIGQLYIDDEWFCFTLEDVVREIPDKPVETWKIHGETAIPTGNYELILQDSPKFGPETPTLLRVPGYKYVRFHAGITAGDTEGCIIVGYQLTATELIRPGSTRPCLRDLKDRLRNRSPIYVTVSGLPTG